MKEAEKWIGDKEDRIMENNKAKLKRERRIMHQENRHRQLRDSIQHNICITGITEEKKKEPDLFELIITEKFPNLGNASKYRRHRQLPSK